MKRGIKLLSIFQINILVLSIFAFCFILNIGVVSAKVHWIAPDGSRQSGAVAPTGVTSYGSFEELEKAVSKKLFPPATETLPATTSIPADKIPHGYGGQAVQSFGGNPLPQGTALVDGKVVPVTTGGASGAGYSVSGIIQGASHALIVAGTIQAFAPMFGADQDLTNTLSSSFSAGVFAGKSLNTLFSKGGEWSSWFGKSKLGMTPGQFSFAAGVATAAIIFYLTYKSEETETKTYTCNPWQAPTGGANCEKCNKQGELPCSEYQCRSLGQSCQLLNPGTDEESCTWAEEFSKELEEQGISVWFEELNVVDGSVTDFVYGFEVEGEKGYVRCERNYEIEEELKRENVTGVFLLFEEDS